MDGPGPHGGVAMECRVDVLDILRQDAFAQRDEVDDASDALEIADGALGAGLLVLSVERTGQSHPPVLKLHLHLVVRNHRVPLDRVDGTLRDLVVRGAIGAGVSNLDLLNERCP